jgi:hypothetical protein
MVDKIFATGLSTELMKKDQIVEDVDGYLQN